MKIFPVLLGLLLFGFISSEIIQNLDVLSSYSFATNYKNYYFRVKVSNQVNMYLLLSANNIGTNSKVDFRLDICGFYDYPSNMDVTFGHEDCISANTPSLERVSNFVYYKYTWKELKDINYLAICLTPMKNGVHPSSIYIYSENMENTEKTDSVVDAGK